MRYTNTDTLQLIGEALGLPGEADLHSLCVPAIEELKARAAMYDWLAAGGIYDIGFDSVGGVSLEQWEEVICEQLVQDAMRSEGSTRRH